jgi:5-methylcytosine-specific restriction endonuclease McrA
MKTRTPIMPYVLKKVKENNLALYGQLTCEICKNPIDRSFHLDHKIPVSKYSKKHTPYRMNGIGNLQITCPQCNLKKSNKLKKYIFKTI